MRRNSIEPTRTILERPLKQFALGQDEIERKIGIWIGGKQTVVVTIERNQETIAHILAAPRSPSFGPEMDSESRRNNWEREKTRQYIESISNELSSRVRGAECVLYGPQQLVKPLAIALRQQDATVHSLGNLSHVTTKQFASIVRNEFRRVLRDEGLRAFRPTRTRH